MPALHRIAGLEVLEVDAMSVTSVSQFAHEPMTLPSLLELHGISGYRVPCAERPWLELRLADGAWISVRPTDEDLNYYILQPVGSRALEGGVEPALLARWGAFARIGALALSALERRSEALVTSESEANTLEQVEPMMGVIAVPVRDIDRSTEQALLGLAEMSGLAATDGAINFAGSFRQ